MFNGKEPMKGIKQVTEKILRDQIFFNTFWQQLLIIRLVFEALDSIVSPEVVEMFFDLYLKRFLDRLSVTESLNWDQKLVKITSFINDSHLLRLLLTDGDKVSHNEREESHTQEHDYNREHHFHLTYWVKISITYSGKRCQREVAACNELFKHGHFVKAELLEPSISFLNEYKIA